jgi:hypothetical protein
VKKVDYNKAIINFEKEASNRTNFSYDPISSKSYDVRKIEESKELYNAFRLKTLFNQESALRVYSNGEWELI